jgi:hypothetical protein
MLKKTKKKFHKKKQQQKIKVSILFFIGKENWYGVYIIYIIYKLYYIIIFTEIKNNKSYQNIKNNK